MADVKLTNIKFKVVGVTFANLNGINRQVVIATMGDDPVITLQRERFNEYDPNAVAVFANGQQIGYIGRMYAAILAPVMDTGRQLSARVTERGQYNGTWYCQITVDER